MGMYTELVMAVELEPDDHVINILKYMLRDTPTLVEDLSHDLFKTERWRAMLVSDSCYFDGETHSELNVDNYGKWKTVRLTVRCNLKDYDDEIDLFLDWLRPYIKSHGFVGYKRYEEYYDPTLIYMYRDKIVYVNTNDLIKE